MSGDWMPIIKQLEKEIIIPENDEDKNFITQFEKKIHNKLIEMAKNIIDPDNQQMKKRLISEAEKGKITVMTIKYYQTTGQEDQSDSDVKENDKIKRAAETIMRLRSGIIKILNNHVDKYKFDIIQTCNIETNEHSVIRKMSVVVFLIMI